MGQEASRGYKGGKSPSSYSVEAMGQNVPQGGGNKSVRGKQAGGQAYNEYTRTGYAGKEGGTFTVINGVTQNN